MVEGSRKRQKPGAAYANPLCSKAQAAKILAIGRGATSVTSDRNVELKHLDLFSGTVPISKLRNISTKNNSLNSTGVLCLVVAP